MDPEVRRRYEALDDYGKRLCHEIGQLVLDAVEQKDVEIVRLKAEIARRDELQRFYVEAQALGRKQLEDRIAEALHWLDAGVPGKHLRTCTAEATIGYAAQALRP